jgi:hypothetical protein
MNPSLKMYQDPDLDFKCLVSLLEQKTPFTFIRFSDGEMEIIVNTKLVISPGSVEWRGGKGVANYPAFDSKSFIPERDGVFRTDLLEAARFRAGKYFKGIRTRGALALRDKNRMIELNGGNSEGLTFADLLINENWKSFNKIIMPLILEREHVVFFGNYRAKPELLSKSVNHLKIGDDFIPSYESVLESSMTGLLSLPRDSTVLSSASSLTNIVGHKLFLARPDLTLIDIGTALNSSIGLGEGLREYHSQALPWSFKNFRKKSLYYLFGSHRIRW